MAVAGGAAGTSASLTVCLRPRPGSALKRVLSVTLPLSCTVSQLRVLAGPALPERAALYLGRLPFVVADAELLGALLASSFGLSSGPPVLVFSVE